VHAVDERRERTLLTNPVNHLRERRARTASRTSSGSNVNLANVKFVAEHEQELEALMKEFETLKPQK
jgi:hypothetical protein